MDADKIVVKVIQTKQGSLDGLPEEHIFHTASSWLKLTSSVVRTILSTDEK